jgi:hypothetical protein
VRTAAWPVPFETAGLSSRDAQGGPPPIPVYAAITAGGRVFACTFDRPLRVQDLRGPNWTGVALHQTFELEWCFVEGDTVVGHPIYGGFDWHNDRCRYWAVPPDVQSLTGVPAASFTAFPLDVN